jgi:RNA recognition motif-containing protein
VLQPEAFEGAASMVQKLFVGGLAFTTTDERLHVFFSQAGEVASAAVVMNRDTGRSRGFGFVEMASTDGALRAVADLNGRELEGRSLWVEVVKPKLDGNAKRRGAPWR